LNVAFSILKTVTNPTEAARAALHRLSQLGLPPTPENFQRYFVEAGGAEGVPAHGRALNVPGTGQPGSRPPESDAEARELMHAVRRFAEQLAEATGTLATDIGQQNAELKVSMNSMDTLRVAPAAPELSSLLNTVLSITATIQSRVETSHAELLRTREDIDQLRTELKESRDWMQQDPLTGMQNRRGMDTILAREVARTRRNGSALSVAMLDIDHFRLLNDTHGHHAGDRALVHFSEISRSVLRETDIIVRYGGEEFLMILPETDLNGARFVVDRLKMVVQKTPLIYEGRKIAISLSAGVAQIETDENASALVLRAERCVLQAKRDGRNRIVVDGH